MPAGNTHIIETLRKDFGCEANAITDKPDFEDLTLDAKIPKSLISPRIADLWLSPFCHLRCGINLAFCLIFTFNWLP